MPTTHDIKTEPESFNAIANRTKRVEVRVNDRNYAVGDLLSLKEYLPQVNRYSGRTQTVKVLHITVLGRWIKGYPVLDNWYAMSISDPLPMQRDDDPDNVEQRFPLPKVQGHRRKIRRQ